MLTRKKPLTRSKKPIRHVSDKRARQMALYRKLRLEYLTANPICEVWCNQRGYFRNGKDYEIITPDGKARGYTASDMRYHGAPWSVEIHHMNGRTHERLNDQTHWIAVCRAAHERIHNNPSWAREHGFLK